MAQILCQELPVFFPSQEPVAKLGRSSGTAIEFQFFFDCEVALQGIDDCGLDTRAIPGTRPSGRPSTRGVRSPATRAQSSSYTAETVASESAIRTGMIRSRPGVSHGRERGRRENLPSLSLASVGGAVRMGECLERRLFAPFLHAFPDAHTSHARQTAGVTIDTGAWKEELEMMSSETR